MTYHKTNEIVKNFQSFLQGLFSVDCRHLFVFTAAVNRSSLLMHALLQVKQPCTRHTEGKMLLVDGREDVPLTLLCLSHIHIRSVVAFDLKTTPA